MRAGTRGLLALLTALLVLSSGCAQRVQSAESTVFAMDTVMSLTFYGQGAQEALDEAVATLYELEGQLSAVREDSPIYALNHAGGDWVELPGETLEVLEKSLELCRATGGALDITAYPAVEAWGFLSGEYRVPGEEERAELAGRIDYSALELSGSAARLPAGMEADLGAVAKGYAADVLTAALEERGVDSALLDLGQSTIRVVGSKPDGSPWRVGVQDPAGEDYLGVLEVSDTAVGTSGGYQRYFEQDGQTYWHIMDPDTAAPARSGLSSVTVVGPSAFTCDALSTALFVMGLEEGEQFWREHPELHFDVLFVTQEGGVYLTGGLEDRFSLRDGSGEREVTVLE